MSSLECCVFPKNRSQNETPDSNELAFGCCNTVYSEQELYLTEPAAGVAGVDLFQEILLMSLRVINLNHGSLEWESTQQLNNYEI